MNTTYYTIYSADSSRLPAYSTFRIIIPDVATYGAIIKSLDDELD